ncbi:hypothetical protein [Robiginitalea sp.]|uniref:hypothetical protein n=2 Tax=Robiginitalea sp. TaxID=1902411 RepID=UPI003C71425A
MKCYLKSNSILLFMAGFLFICTSGEALQGQDIRTERVSFRKGTSSATIEGSITGRETVDYLLNVRSGQNMNVSMTSGNSGVYFNIMEPGEEYVAIYNASIDGNQFEGTTAKSGDYRIRVYLMKGAQNGRADYRLEMIVSGSGQSATSGDAMVSGTDYNATGMIPCSMGNGQPTGNCKYGVIRQGNGSGMVTITKSDGRTRTIYFENGKATGYDESQADRASFRASKEYDLYIVHIGDERYEIPEAVINGG